VTRGLPGGLIISNTEGLPATWFQKDRYFKINW